MPTVPGTVALPKVKDGPTQVEEAVRQEFHGQSDVERARPCDRHHPVGGEQCQRARVRDGLRAPLVFTSLHAAVIIAHWLDCCEQPGQGRL